MSDSDSSRRWFEALPSAFLLEVRRRTDRLDARELRAVLGQLALDLDPLDREDLLDLLSSPPEMVMDEVVLLRSDLQAFERDVTVGAYAHRPRDDRGRPAWKTRFQALLDAVDRVLWPGRGVQARDAYRLLLGLLARQPARLGEARAPWKALDRDINSIKARFLWLTVAHAQENPMIELFEALTEMATVGSNRVGLAALCAVDAPPVDDWTQFRLSWWLLLEHYATSGGSPGTDPLTGFLVREVSEAVVEELREPSHVVDRLQDLPVLMVPWVRALVRVDRADEASALARRLAQVVRDSRQRLPLAEAWGWIALRRNDLEGAVEAWRMAWRVAPAPQRLRMLGAVDGPGSQDRDSRLVDELEQVEQGRIEPPPPLLGWLELAVGDYETPLIRLREGGAAEVNRPGSEAAFLFGCCALLASGRHRPPRDTCIQQVCQESWGVLTHPRVGGERSRHRFEVTMAGWTDLLWPEAFATRRPPPLKRIRSLREILFAAIQERPVDRELRLRITRILDPLVRETAARILRKNQRTRYRLAARRVVAVAELWALLGMEERGSALLEGIVAEHPRHRAFRSELERERRLSTVLHEVLSPPGV